VNWDPNFGIPGNGLDQPVSAMALFDDGTGTALYAGGYFQHAGGVAVHSVAKWDGTAWSPLGTSFTGTVLALAAFDDGTGPALYAGGYIYVADGVPMHFMTRWNGSSWSDVGGGVDSVVYAFAVHDDGTGPALYAAGAFNNASGAPAAKVARWNGSTWSAVGSGLVGSINTLASFDDGSGPALFAGGNAPNTIRKWDGSTWSIPGGGVNGGVLALAPYGGSLYAAGGFGSAGGNTCNNIARWDGTQWSPVGTASTGGGANNSILTLGVCDLGGGPLLYAGGGFDSVNYHAVEAHQMASWDGTTWSALGSGLTGFGIVSGAGPLAICGFNGGIGSRVYVGGMFTTISGMRSDNIAVWGSPCAPASISQQPLSQSAVFPDPVVFRITARGNPPLSYQWRKDGVPIANVSGKIEGATTPTMTIYYWSLNDEGNYDCQVTNPYGVTTSDEAVLTVPGNGTTGAPIVLTKILLPPEPVPGLPGATFTSFGSSIQAATSDVSFYGRIEGAGNTNQSLNLWQSGTTQLLDMNWAQAPGTPSGVLFDHFGGFLIGADGKLAFSAVLLGPGIDGLNNTGIWYHDVGGEDLVARFGDPAVGGPAGSTFRNNLMLESFSDSGQILFSGTLYNGGSFVAGGYWVWDRASGQSLVAINGQTAPGTSATFANLQYRQMVESRSGTVALFSDLSGGPSWGLWTGQPGALQLVALSGDQVPGYPAGTTFLYVDSPVLNELDDLAFRAQIQDPGGSTRWMVLRWRAGVFDTILSQGDPAPGIPGETIFACKPIEMNENGAFLIYSSVASGSCTDNCPSYGFFLVDASGIDRIITDRADPLPEAPPGFTLGSLGPVAMNNAEQVVLTVTLYHGQSFGTTYGWTREHGLFPVAIPGSQIEVTPGDYRTVAGAGMSFVDGGVGGLSTDHNAGPSRNLNDAGQVLMAFGFSDFVSGIFTGQFTTYESRYFAPGTPFCAGDGTLATPCPCGNFGLPGHGCDNSIATGGAILTCVGGASLAADTLTLTSAGERLTALSVFLQGTTRLSAGVPYGDGVRCVGGILKRIGVKAAVGGVVTYPGASDLSVSARSDALGDVIHPGETRYYQIYYRDPTQTFCPNPPGGTFNTSSGQIIPWFP
jgi:hypothetical protein